MLVYINIPTDMSFQEQEQEQEYEDLPFLLSSFAGIEEVSNGGYTRKRVVRTLLI